MCVAKKRLIKQDENQKSDALFVRLSIENCSANDVVVVDEAYHAIVIKNGQLMQSLNPGKHQLVKRGKSKDLYEVVFFPKTLKIKMLWGTKEQFSFRDPIENVMLKVGANGEIDLQIVSPRKFFLELGSKKEDFTIHDLKESVQAKLLMYLEEFISKFMVQNKLSYEQFEEQKNMVANEIKPYVSSQLENSFGLRIASLTINGVIIPNQFLKELLDAKTQRLGLTKEKLEKKVKEEETFQKNVEIVTKVSSEMLTQTVQEENMKKQEQEQNFDLHNKKEQEQDGMLLL